MESRQKGNINIHNNIIATRVSRLMDTIVSKHIVQNIENREIFPDSCG
jgi:hypothetical protein